MFVGDYTKIIVNCTVWGIESSEKFRAEILERLPLHTSAYHCGGELLQVEQDKTFKAKWHVTFITQAKYGKGIKEFIEWLGPKVMDGFGSDEIFAIEIDEYSPPRCHHVPL
jgi:hypothetical protein